MQSVKMRQGLTCLLGHLQASCDLAKLPTWPSWPASIEESIHGFKAIRGINIQGKE